MHRSNTKLFTKLGALSNDARTIFSKNHRWLNGCAKANIEVYATAKADFGPRCVNPVFQNCCGSPEWLVFPPRSSTEYYADAAFSTLRAHAARKPNSHNGLVPDFRRVSTQERHLGRRSGAAKRTFLPLAPHQPKTIHSTPGWSTCVGLPIRLDQNQMNPPANPGMCEPGHATSSCDSRGYLNRSDA
jgi:hypothetical protein